MLFLYDKSNPPYSSLCFAHRRYLKEDLAANKALGDFGAEALKSIWKGVGGGLNLMTVCNTGSLATSGHGTALGVVRSLHSSGDLASLGVLETRPYNQGARLTAFEAVEEVRSDEDG